MTAPGLALFYGGLVRRKNVLSVMMQCIFLMGLMTVLWAIYGYSLAFGGDGGWIGNGDYVLMNGVQREWSTTLGEPVTPMEGDMTRMTHMLFQGMFFIITPALICGAFAERMKFSAMVIFSFAWGTFIYCPLCHWVWDGGPLSYNDTSIMGGALDFCRWNRGSYQQRYFRTGRCDPDRSANGLPERTHPTSQPDLHRVGSSNALGGLVRFQCW